MNKTLRLLFLSGLAAISCASCSKVEQLFPESFERNKNPFSVEAVPQEGRDTLIFFRIKGNDSIKTQFYPTDTTLKFKVGDSIILEARAKNGYTFINWVRDGNGVSDNPIYGFKLDSLDIDKSTHFVKHHYEARFGLDYALQVIPPIDSIIPAELIKAMGPYLHFGDNPPKIDGCFSLPDSIMFDKLIKADTNGDYRYDSMPMRIAPIDHYTFVFERQHRGIAECFYYECQYPYGMAYLYATVKDSIFIMGEGDYFTAYFHQDWKPWSSVPWSLVDLNSCRESVILSGKIGDNGIEEFRWGRYIESYNPTNFSYIDLEPSRYGVPGTHDILIYNSNRTLLYNPTFQKHFND